MPLRYLLPRKPLLSPLRRTARTTISRRFQSSTPSPHNPKSSTEAHTSSQQARANKILDRVPRFLRPYTDGLRNAPVSHIVSFLILHELTAIIPLAGFTALFLWSPRVPSFIRPETLTANIEKYGNYIRRKGYFNLDKDAQLPAISVPDSVDDLRIEETEIEQRWNISREGSRLVVAAATAYAITKVLLPVRLVGSVWATPWFARVVLGRVTGVFGRRGGGVGKV